MSFSFRASSMRLLLLATALATSLPIGQANAQGYRPGGRRYYPPQEHYNRGGNYRGGNYRGGNYHGGGGGVALLGGALLGLGIGALAGGALAQPRAYAPPPPVYYQLPPPMSYAPPPGVYYNPY